jgi:hypothetical protein
MRHIKIEYGTDRTSIGGVEEWGRGKGNAGTSGREQKNRQILGIHPVYQAEPQSEEKDASQRQKMGSK